MESVQFFASFVFIYISVGVQIIKREGMGSHKPHKHQNILPPVISQHLDFQRHMSLSCFTLNDLKWEVIVRSVDICGIVDYYCLNLPLIISNLPKIQCPPFSFSTQPYNNNFLTSSPLWVNICPCFIKVVSNIARIFT